MHGGWWRRLGARPILRDAVVAAVWLVVGLVLWLVGAYPMWQQVALVDAPAWVFLAFLAAMTGLGLLRSRRPFLALGLGLAVAAGDGFMGGSLGVLLALADLVYAAIIYGSEAAVWRALKAAAIAGLAFAVALIWLAPRNPAIAAALVQWGLVLIVSGMWGWSVRSERSRTRAQLAQQHARETHSLRSTIAHDLHDLVANQIAVAGLHIEAAKLQTGRTDPDAAALAVSLDRAKQGTDHAHRELRGLISVLTMVDDDTPLGPVAIEAELADLERLLPAGRQLRVDPGALRVLREWFPPPEAPRARLLLRALRELVANAAQHGAGDAELTASVTETGLCVLLENELAGESVPRPSGTGLGLTGVRVLLGSLGGTFEAAARGDRWRATLGVPAPSAAGQVDERTGA